MMKKALLFLSLLMIVLSCGPSRHAIHVEMRHQSRSGIELAGKIITVIYVSDDDDTGNMVSENMADSFVKALEEWYGTGEGSVGLFCIDGGMDDYSDRDLLISLLMDTGSDVVFLMDVEQSGERTAAGQPVKVNMYCYDGMDREDKVRSFSGVKVLSASDESELMSEASKAGRIIAEQFESQWKHEQYSIAYYDNAKWYEALIKADKYDWKGAMDIWISLLDTKDLLKKASAEYNIAIACYMLGDFHLAQQWLDLSDADNKLPTLSDALRKRIEARIL